MKHHEHISCNTVEPRQESGHQWKTSTQFYLIQPQTSRNRDDATFHASRPSAFIRIADTRSGKLFARLIVYRP